MRGNEKMSGECFETRLMNDETDERNVLRSQGANSSSKAVCVATHDASAVNAVCKTLWNTHHGC